MTRARLKNMRMHRNNKAGACFPISALATLSILTDDRQDIARILNLFGFKCAILCRSENVAIVEAYKFRGGVHVAMGVVAVLIVN